MPEVNAIPRVLESAFLKDDTSTFRQALGLATPEIVCQFVRRHFETMDPAARLAVAKAMKLEELVRFMDAIHGDLAVAIANVNPLFVGYDKPGVIRKMAIPNLAKILKLRGLLECLWMMRLSLLESERRSR